MIRTAYEDAAVSPAQVFRWYKAFKNDCESIKDVYRSRRSSRSKTDENMAKVHSLLTWGRCLTFRPIAHEISMSKGTDHRIVTKELGMRNICANLVSKNLPNQ
ncbi:hypothetical protein Trydic_g17993 [Trypoxylus dichotomus]